MRCCGQRYPLRPNCASVQCLHCCACVQLSNSTCLILLNDFPLAVAGLKSLTILGAPNFSTVGLCHLTHLTALQQLIVEGCNTVFDDYHHHHVTQSSHSINAIGPIRL
jgi:hypothetical protein